MTTKRFGEPGFGVPENQQSAPKPEKPLTNKPDWNEFMHPDKLKDAAKKPRPTETDKPPVPPAPVKKGRR